MSDNFKLPRRKVLGAHVKSGDLATLCLGIEIEGKPAPLEIGESVVNDDNTVNEAEVVSDTLDELGATWTPKLAS